MRLNLIGEDIEVIKAKNQTLEGLKGRVIDETKNTLSLESEDKIRKILKKGIKFKIKIRDETRIIDGADLIGRPEERLKKSKRKVKKRW